MRIVLRCRHVERPKDGPPYRCDRDRKDGSDYCWAHNYPHGSGRVAVSEQLELAPDAPY